MFKHSHWPESEDERQIAPRETQRKADLFAVDRLFLLYHAYSSHLAAGSSGHAAHQRIQRSCKHSPHRGSDQCDRHAPKPSRRGWQTDRIWLGQSAGRAGSTACRSPPLPAGPAPAQRRAHSRTARCPLDTAASLPGAAAAAQSRRRGCRAGPLHASCLQSRCPVGLPCHPAVSPLPEIVLGHRQHTTLCTSTCPRHCAGSGMVWQSEIVQHCHVGKVLIAHQAPMHVQRKPACARHAWIRVTGAAKCTAGRPR